MCLLVIIKDTTPGYTMTHIYTLCTGGGGGNFGFKKEGREFSKRSSTHMSCSSAHRIPAPELITATDEISGCLGGKVDAVSVCVCVSGAHAATPRSCLSDCVKMHHMLLPPLVLNVRTS